MIRSILLAVLFASLIGCAHKAAEHATAQAQASLVGYQKNMVAGWEGELQARLKGEKERIDKLVDGALKAETKPDGTINAVTAEVIYANRIRLMAELFAEEVRVRRAIADAQEDAANAGAYLGALREAWQKKVQASEVTAQASEFALKMLEKLLEKKANP